LTQEELDHSGNAALTEAAPPDLQS
jgi:hypothetical protein